MFTPQRALRLMIEIIFVFLGALMMWLALSGRITVERHKPAWFILSGALILWGLRALYGPDKWWARWENWTRGISLVLLGLVMLVITHAPFLWIGPLLAIAGGLMCARGVIGTVLVFRLR